MASAQTPARSLAGKPALIERLWPAQKISVEAQKERKAVQSQTLTALGSYWKGRKPLILVRACILGALLPATDDPTKDLEIFESLMRIDDDAFLWRDQTTKPAEIAQIAMRERLLDSDGLRECFSIRGTAEELSDEELRRAIASGKAVWRTSLPQARREKTFKAALSKLPYAERVGRSIRPEDLDEKAYSSIWGKVNAHLGTDANSVPEMIDQLGIMRYGHRPRVADTFAGGGSIPFEAARVGCDVYASDLNPVACMLTWGALNIIGDTEEERIELDATQTRIVDAVQAEIDALDVEQNEAGDRAKAYLYCVEARCPSSQWMVPLLPTMVVSKSRNAIAKLVPDPRNRRYRLEIESGVDAAAMRSAELGTVQDGYLVHEIDGVQHRSSLKSVRGEYRMKDGSTASALRLWERQDIEPRPDDVLQERLYCIQWIRAETLNAGRQTTYFAEPTAEDIERERAVSTFVAGHLTDWQEIGLVPDMRIEPGFNTDQPIRERGWTHWHHLFTPRQLLFLGLASKHSRQIGSAASMLLLAKTTDWSSRLCRYGTGAARESIAQTFYNQALNTFLNYGCRSFEFARNYLNVELPRYQLSTNRVIENKAAIAVDTDSDIYVTDPPYADAVNYHEISEFFIAWLRKSPPAPFDQWTWDSRRSLAIKGSGEDFRRDMVAAYANMAAHMPDDGMQIVMFTHQSGAVWADMAQIFWGAGLQVRSAWYIATETSTELKKGGYVQGTVILVLRKLADGESGYEDEIAQEVRSEVARQIDTLVGLNQQTKGAGRIENLFEDPDLQMAGYAAALRVLTGYTRIDGRDMTVEAGRPRKKGEKSFVDRIIEFAVQVANEHMVPEGLTPRLWQDLSGTERFYLKMLDLEAEGLTKLDNYQNLARAFRVTDYNVLMADVRPNAARVKTAADFKRRVGFEIADFGEGVVRAVLYGIWELSAEADPEVVIEQLRGMVENYYRKREDMIGVADYIASKRGRDDEREGRYAALLANLLRNERL